MSRQMGFKLSVSVPVVEEGTGRGRVSGGGEMRLGGGAKPGRHCPAPHPEPCTHATRFEPGAPTAHWKLMAADWVGCPDQSSQGCHHHHRERTACYQTGRRVMGRPKGSRVGVHLHARRSIVSDFPHRAFERSCTHASPNFLLLFSTAECNCLASFVRPLVTSRTQMSTFCPHTAHRRSSPSRFPRPISTPEWPPFAG